MSAQLGHRVVTTGQVRTGGGLLEVGNHARRLIIQTPMDKRLDCLKMARNRRISSKTDVKRVGIVDRFGLRISLTRCCVSHIVTKLPTRVRCGNRRFPLHMSQIVPRIGSRRFIYRLAFDNGAPTGVHLNGDCQILLRLNGPRRTLIVPGNSFFRAAGKC